ncbi:MAG: TonB-dependent receptor [Acidobacteria bacterium]|nr:TonB-dependent receptor [Acidobacteriota bacterium]
MRKILFSKISIALAAVCVAACAALAQSQGAAVSSITGRVVDPRGAGLAGALVTLYAREPLLRLNAVTDPSGAYRFERLAPGEYLIEADARGFAPAPARRVRLRSGESATADLALEVAGLRDEVVVTASDTAQAVDEVSKSLTTVTLGEAEERDEYSVAEALRTVPGLRVQQLGGPGSFFSIKTRGLRNQDTAVLFDGLRFRDPGAPQGDASGYLSDLDIVNLSRVEVLRGSGSSLYGTNAVGGVVNIVTDEGGSPTRGQLLFEGGALGFFRGRAQVSGGTDDNRVAYSAGVSHRNVTRGVDSTDAARNTSGRGRALFRLTPAMTLMARGYASDSFLQLNDDPRPVEGTLPSGVVDARPVSRAELRRFESGARAASLANAGATFIPSANDPDASRATRFFSGALRFNHRPFESFGYTFIPRSNTKLRAHAGNGYRAPSLFERFGSSFSSLFGGFSPFGDPRLAPERAIAFDAGIDQTFSRNRARLSATYFYTRLQEVIVFDFTGLVPPDDPFKRFGGYVNTRGGLARGVELEFDSAPTRALDVRASYTFTNSDERTPRLGQTRAFAIPDHQFSLVATGRVGRRAFFNFDLAATSDYLAPVFDPSSFASRVYRFGGALKADAGASYRLPLAESRALRFFGVVENLTGRDYYESGFRTPGRTARAGAQFNF